MAGSARSNIGNSPPWPDLQKRLKLNFQAWSETVESFIPPKLKPSQAAGCVTIDYLVRGEWAEATCTVFGSDAGRNLHALVLAFESLRKAEQRGIAGLYRDVATAVAALPAPHEPNQYLRTIGLEGAGHSRPVILSAYREALKRSHPDHGGSRERFAQVQEAGRELGIT